ncbi:MAG: RtcB family protein [Clostridia bacterium]|nr:RtcB family protein [Clostridia bacterium]
MYDIVGKYNKATIYALNVDSESYAQVLRICNTEELKDSVIRMMPDMHASAGCTVGTSMTIGEKINPAYVGSDIGCGMQVYRLRKTDVNFEALDRAVRELIPFGAAIFHRSNPAIRQIPLEDLYSAQALHTDVVMRSLGTLGGGNHFIEVNRSMDGGLYLVIHSGSRRLGKDVALYHQDVAFFICHGITPAEAVRKKIRPVDIKSTLSPEQCFLSGEYKEQYLHDMNIAKLYADVSRKDIGQKLIDRMGWIVEDSFATVHNYIDTEQGILRKGAVSAQKDQRLIIPINMRDGSLICRGKGNSEWNYTAPHGAGRLMKRSEAKAAISLEEYREAMKGIYTTSVNESTIDESPMAYRSIDDILDTVEPTVDVVDVILPVYNFKASRSEGDEETADGEG